jgi:hypothetical protein
LIIPWRRYPHGRGEMGPKSESYRDGGTHFIQLRITLHRGMTYCWLSVIMWALSRFYSELWLCL